MRGLILSATVATMTQIERCQLVAETKISLATVTKWDKGGSVHSTIDAALRMASSKLGLTRAADEVTK